MLIHHRSPLLKLFTSRALMLPTPLVKPAPCAVLPPLPWRTHHFNTPRLIFSTSPIFLKSCCLSNASNASIPITVRSESPPDTVADSTAMKALTKRLKEHGFGNEFSRTGQHRLLCPTCKGGDTMGKSLSLNISPDGNTAVWFCHRATCGSKGTTKAFVDVTSTYRSMNKISMVKQTREMTEETLKLEPPCGVALTKRLKELGFGSEFSRTGEHRLLCPTCKRGDTMGKSLSLNISPDGSTAVWFCHRTTCGSKGTTKAFVDVKSTYRSMNKISMVKQTREMTEETLKLEPPCGVALTKRLKELGFGSEFSRTGEHRVLCPTCKGGDTMEKSVALNISPDGNTALWFCHRATCGSNFTTKAFADVTSTYRSINKISMVKQTREMTEETLKLEPPCGATLGYFAERFISKETLQRNSVRQRKHGDQIAIAFPYRRNGVIVGCKYRDINKKFWQEKDTEKIFYGLDDIKDASDIIIVEGEMDKLSMEEAGFRNCVSVPDGAPASVSNKELPPEEKDTKYQYLWNCNDYLEKASRIILATDGDPPGQALAEELARRLGRERCWRVRWPKKNDVVHFTDANEVLMIMGPGALREVIESAELYPIRGLFKVRDYFDEIDSYYH